MMIKITCWSKLTFVGLSRYLYLNIEETKNLVIFKRSNQK